MDLASELSISGRTHHVRNKIILNVGTVFVIEGFMVYDLNSHKESVNWKRILRYLGNSFR